MAGVKHAISTLSFYEDEQMSDINSYGDRVTSVAQDVANKLDRGNSKGAQDALHNELNRMSPQEYNRLLQEVNQREQKPGQGNGFDIQVSQEPSNGKSNGRDSFLIVPSLPGYDKSLPGFEKPATNTERVNGPKK
jgi:hypothetical protein